MSGPEPPPPGGVPSEEELRAAYEAELARITATDMIAQAAVSLLNIGARRMGPPPAPEGAPAPPGAERDLDQVRDSIDAAMALLGILERRIAADQLGPLRDALSRLQMAYATEIGGSGGGEGGPDEGDEGPAGPDGGAGGQGGPGGGKDGGGGTPAPGPGGQQRPGPGPAESSGRLWVPGG